jgi:hypothetical protein
MNISNEKIDHLIDKPVNRDFSSYWFENRLMHLNLLCRNNWNNWNSFKILNISKSIDLSISQFEQDPSIIFFFPYLSIYQYIGSVDMKSVCHHEMPPSCDQQANSVFMQSDHQTRIIERHGKRRIHKQTTEIEHRRRLQSISSTDGLWYVASWNNESRNRHGMYPPARCTNAMSSTFWWPASCQAINYQWLGNLQSASKLYGWCIKVI